MHCRGGGLAPIAMQMGIPVYTEKPPATTAADTLAVARMSEKTGVLCMTAFKKRYSRVYQHAREWIGKYPSADRYALAVNYASAHYFNDTGRNSYLLDFAIHLIDLMGYLFGDVDKVFCFAKGYDAYAVSLRFACGAVGTMDLNDGRAWAVPTEEVEITLRGGNFMSIHNSSQWCITEDGEPSAWREPATFVSSGGSGADTGHLTEIVDFLAAIREGRSTRSHVRESYKSMVLYEGIAESARTGKVVTLKYEA
jgi:predicted dehydrogenase